MSIIQQVTELLAEHSALVRELTPKLAAIRLLQAQVAILVEKQQPIERRLSLINGPPPPEAFVAIPTAAPSTKAKELFDCGVVVPAPTVADPPCLDIQTRGFPRGIGRRTLLVLRAIHAAPGKSPHALGLLAGDARADSWAEHARNLRKDGYLAFESTGGTSALGRPSGKWLLTEKGEQALAHCANIH